MNDLEKKTCKELREVAKEYGIVGRWGMNKQELIKAIEEVSNLTDDDIVFENDCIIKEEKENQSEGHQGGKMTTLDYLNKIEKGALIAFEHPFGKNKVMSAKLVSNEDGAVTLVTKQGTILKVPHEKIIWVKTNGPWPKWVLSMFFNGKKRKKEVNNDNAIS